MSERGRTYLEWASPELHCRGSEKRLVNGLLIDVQARLSAISEVQLFIGVYEKSGAMLFEDAYLSRDGETMTQAMKWGTRRAMDFIESLNLPKAQTPSQPANRQEK